MPRQELTNAADRTESINAHSSEATPTEVAYSPLNRASYAPPADTEQTTIIDIPGVSKPDGPVAMPVVGWMVCTKGANKGRSYELHSGWNYIGRNPQMAVNISDPACDRAGTARVGYDTRKHNFLIGLCDNTKNMVYVNDETLVNQVKLAAYDIVSIGDTDLLFIPLCGDKFSWEG